MASPLARVRSTSGYLASSLLLTGVLMGAWPCLAPAVASPDSSRNGAPAMLEPHTASLLVDYYDAFLRDHDIDAFRQNVLARYTEGTLARLAQSGDTRTRRAAVLALGLVGSFEVNEVVGRALRDRDSTVRSLADNALWAIWFRADTPENNATLERVRALIGQQRPENAADLATRLIGRAPKFAEAYNQRAIAQFLLGRFEQSAADCRKVLELNPYHFGAMSGLGQCYIRLGQRDEAIKIFRRALHIQPYSEGIRELIAGLEADSA
ncbi:MAG TPA: tetratricopeptide repeat protein [Isosphaeraceae bacterium]|jgi:tetratricopeptide (TPR) repeat protein|nr:tetratricopeptide repeat protein [Isosphaeraceae bacterium]